ncbi:hypothetical protein [Lactobacillus melliventris]|uniref:Transposase n=1 Tax=Lactobacillus melliventris TaxID=1218507 RepID=A0ABX5MZX6_9LACO|nr:hypothetical protein [Lactobacillus melliventris]PXY84411.1 hypothetical protein DK873_04460 [Lactobacillus melliventris]
MANLSKQDKIEIFNLWQNYQVGTTELSRRYQVNPSTINYLLALINRHGTAILDRPIQAIQLRLRSGSLDGCMCKIKISSKEK